MSKNLLEFLQVVSLSVVTVMIVILGVMFRPSYGYASAYLAHWGFVCSGLLAAMFLWVLLIKQLHGQPVIDNKKQIDKK